MTVTRFIIQNSSIMQHVFVICWGVNNLKSKLRTLKEQYFKV